jgi:phosphoserine phosphatase
MPLHQRDEQRETDKDNHGTMKPEFQFCASHIPPAENLRLNVARSAGYKVASCVIFLACANEITGA